MRIWKPGEDERAYFNAFVMAFGTDRLAPDKVWVPPGDLVEDGFCWGGAWDTARRLGARYVEGMCQLQQSDGTAALVRAHAWVERHGRVIEVTKGYEDATAYRGFAMNPIDGGPADMHSRIFETMPQGRYSIIEWLVVQGWDLRDIHDLLKAE